MKRNMVICAPVTSVSGYGEHARDLVFSFIENDKYDINIIDVPWGDCPRTALKDEDEKTKKISSCLLTGQLNQQPEIYVDIRIPSEFQTIGKFNIGITAGIETNAVSQNWIEGCNKMDLVIVPSEHAKNGFIDTLYEKVQNLPNGQTQNIGQLKMTTPIEVLFEGADENIYKPLTKDEIDSDFFDWLNNEVPEKFAFLFVGLWGTGGMGEDRKDVGTLVKTFYESFANKKKQPALILKTSGATQSIIDKEECLAKIKNIKSRYPKDWKLPNVYLLHGNLSSEDMNYLYNHPKVKSMVSLTHGEGYGRPLLEASMVGLPVITTGWSGQLDFLNKDNSLILPGELKEVPESAHWENIIIPQSKWFYVHEPSAYKALNLMYENTNEYKRKSKILMEKNRNKFTLNKMIDKLDSIMGNHLKDQPTQVKLKLPKLKKVMETS